MDHFPEPKEIDLWGPSRTLSCDAVGFEDSFSPSIASSENNYSVEDGDNKHTAFLASSYVPLQDSSQYLAGLERKLARVQGRSENQRKAESKRLIDALAGTRSAHVSQMMQDPGTQSENHEEPTPSHIPATVDPHGALGVVLRRVAPEKVALAPEELCRLLEADILANIHKALEDMPDTSVHNTQEGSVKASSEGQMKENEIIKTSKSPQDQKDPSSDEGEK